LIDLKHRIEYSGVRISVIQNLADEEASSSRFRIESWLELLYRVSGFLSSDSPAKLRTMQQIRYIFSTNRVPSLSAPHVIVVAGFVASFPDVVLVDCRCFVVLLQFWVSKTHAQVAQEAGRGAERHKWLRALPSAGRRAVSRGSLKRNIARRMVSVTAARFVAVFPSATITSRLRCCTTATLPSLFG
jgi:hypothetical protein